MTRAWPLGSSLDPFIMHLGQYVLAPQFEGGKAIPSKNPSRRGAPVVYTGGYSAVYPIQCPDRKLALRCWTRDPGQVAARYSASAEYLGGKCCRSIVHFGYVENGIRIGGETYPLSYMDWVEGSTLNDFLDANIRSPDIIVQTAEAFQRMVAELHKLGVAHGDLQGGNIIAHKDNGVVELRLVDYDSLYVPTLSGTAVLDDALPGVAEYQHPRRLSHGSEKADYFSELVIYLSLRAYAEDASLWCPGQERRLLFEPEEFLRIERNPGSSALYGKLMCMSPLVRHLTRQLEEYCRAPNTECLSPLEYILPEGTRSGSQEEFPRDAPGPSPQGTPSREEVLSFQEYFSGLGSDRGTTTPPLTPEVDLRPVSGISEFEAYFAVASPRGQPSSSAAVLPSPSSTATPSATPAPNEETANPWFLALVLVVVIVVVAYALTVGGGY